MKKNFKDIMFFGFIFLLIDQVIKFILSSKMILNSTSVIIKDFFSITLVHNTGAAFSLFENSRIFLILMGLIALVVLFFYIKKVDTFDDIDIFIYSLLICGIACNLVDRIVQGYVIDYLSFKFGQYYFPIFNFADICIVVAILIILIKVIREDLWK